MAQLLEVLPNLRHAGVFQMSTMVKLGIGFKEPLTFPGIKKYLLFDSATWRIQKFPLAGIRCCDSKKISCHAILKNQYGEPKMDVILTISFNITAEIKITKHIKGINKKQEKYHVSREKIVQSILNIWINNLNFYRFLQFMVRN